MANPLHIDADVVFHCKNKIDVYLIIFCSFKKFFQQNSSSMYHIFINKSENLTSEKCITLLFRKTERKKMVPPCFFFKLSDIVQDKSDP